MKKLILFFLLLGLLSLSAKSNIELNSSLNGIAMTAMNEDGLEISCGIESLSSFSISSDRGSFSELSAAGFSYRNEIGLPKLPEQAKLIAVPLNAEVVINLNSQDIIEYDLSDWNINNRIIPVQPPLAKSADPSEADFVINEAAYQQSKWHGSEIITTEEIGILRGMRIFRLVYAPVAYNPVTGKVLIRNNVDASVTFVGSDLASTNELRTKTWSPAFEKVYGQNILNYSRLETRDDITRYPIKYVIIYDAMFTTQLQPFISWKTRQGYEVITASTNEIGSTTTAIANYIEGLWEEATPSDPAPSFILFVGDTDQIPAYNGSQGSHVTDLNYVRLEGGDFMPEIYYGRFSARTTAELQPQIDKTLEYEMFTMPDPSYLGEAVMIAGMDSSHGSTWGNGQINYGTSNYFNTAHGITSHTYLYPASGSSSAQIIQNVSDGVGYINYTAHGSSTSWADPSFTISNINSLQNEHEYPLAVGNCCLTNKFEVGECFGEAWLREEDGGSIGYIGGTNSTYWDEDFWWGVGSGNITSNPTYTGTGPGAYDGMFHDHGEDFDQWYTATGAVIMAGNLAVVQGGGSYNYYWEIYTLMGDPSLQPYFGVPEVNDVAHNAQIFIGASSFTVSAQPYSYVGLSFGDELLAAGITDDSGNIVLEFSPLTAAGTLDLVVTAQNHEPYFAEIQAVPNEGAFLSIANYTLTTDNGDEIIDFDESVELSLDLENIGIDPAENITAVMTVTDPYVTVTNATVNYALIAPGETETITGFSFNVAQTIPDQHEIELNFVFTCDSDENEGLLNLTASAPVLGLGNVFIISDDNGNGRLDPGETAEMELEITNTGHSTVETVLCMVESNNTNVSISNTWSFIPEIMPNDSGNYPFLITVDENCPIGENVLFSADVTAETELTHSGSFSLNVGLNLEDFESGNLNEWEWVTSGDADWFVTQSSPYEGSFCAESGDIGNSDISSLSIELDVLYDDEISFYRKVSSETNWDYLFFYIDGEEMASWSGNLGWEEVSFPVSAGTHTLSWVYDKDGSVSSGSDCAWLDYIIFPAIGIPQPPEMTCSITSINQSIPLNSTLAEDFTITNTGGGTLYYNLSIQETDRSIEGSSFTCDAETYIPGQQVTWNFEVYNNSGDAEWLTDVIVDFPDGVSVTSATDFTGASGDLVYNGTTGNGVSVEWNDPNGGWGQIHGNETATAEVTVMIDENTAGDLDLDWTLIGDDYGSAPHEISGTVTITTEIMPLTWAELNQYSGVLNPYETDDLTITFDSSELDPGIYTADLIINDNRNITTIPITLSVGGDIVYGDIDDNGYVEALDASLILQYAVGIDPSPFAPLPWEAWRQIRADVDGNGSIEAYDASLVLQYYVGIINEFPVNGTRSIDADEVELDYTVTAGEVTLSTEKELYSLMIFADRYDVTVNTVYCEDALYAANQQDMFKLALANALPQKDNIISLNYNGAIEEDIYFRYYANGIEKELTIPAQELMDAQLPQVTQLTGNYPNPFNPSTIIRYELAENTKVKIDIYNLKGQKVKTLVNENQNAGSHQIEWNAENTASGIYFYKMHTGSNTQTKRMILLK